LRSTTYQFNGSKPRKRTPQTIVSVYNVLRSLWHFAVRRGYAIKNVTEAINVPPVPAPPVKPISAHHLQMMFKLCGTDDNNMGTSRKKAILGMLLEMGLRNSELCNLRWGDVNLEQNGGSVYVKMSKGNKSRIVPFSKKCKRYLQNYLLYRPGIKPDDHLFLSNQNTPFNDDSLYKLVKRIGEQAGINCSPHTFRTTAACMMLKNGISVHELKKILGHADIETTMRYVRAAEIDLDDAMRRASPLDNIRGL
jgi:integrase/recombinase XerD